MKYFNEENSISQSWLIFYNSNLSIEHSSTLLTSLFQRNTKKKNSIPIEEIKSEIDNASKEYKIHLMPKPDKIQEIGNKLIEALDNSSLLRESISGFKIAKNPRLVKSKNGYMPFIVIYIKPGKENAQIALSHLTQEFKNFEKEGSNITPRFNRKINQLIYYSQGDSECKKHAKKANLFNEFFDRDGVHFKNGDYKLDVKTN